MEQLNMNDIIEDLLANDEDFKDFSYEEMLEIMDFIGMEELLHM